jgi:hypothetical protein
MIVLIFNVVSDFSDHNLQIDRINAMKTGVRVRFRSSRGEADSNRVIWLRSGSVLGN